MSKVEKTYESRGTGVITFPFTINEKKVFVEFSEGSKKKRKMAEYTTSDPEIQEKLEGTTQFRRGTIKLKSQRAIKEKTTPGSSEQGSGTKREKSGIKKGRFTGPKTIQEAINKLHTHKNYKVPMEELGSPDAVLAKAKELGVEFPNVNFEP